MTRAHVRNFSGDCTRVPHGDGLQPSIALSLSPAFLSRQCCPLNLVGRRVWVATALVLFTLALPAPAQAALQVSNLGQGTTTLRQRGSFASAQGFQTGPQRAGYSLTSVQLHMDSFGDPTTIYDLRVSLRTRETGSVDGPSSTDWVTFDNPSFTRTHAGTATFTLPTDRMIDLTPNTAYFVTIDIKSRSIIGVNRRGVNIGTTTETDEDTGAAAGWEIHDDSYSYRYAPIPSQRSWQSTGSMYRIAVNATPKNIPATGLPTITGTASMVGDTLTAVTTGISDADGLAGVSYSYQWIRVDDMAVETEISGAMSSTYTLVAADVGKHFKVKVAFQDNTGFDEARTSKLYPARTGGICARTEQVHDAIVAATAATTCANVTATHLARLGILNLRNQSISRLQSGDFAGLTELNQLTLRNNALRGLPAGLFSGLTKLEDLNLSDNALSSLPANIFAGLTALERLTLQNNALTLSGLPAGLFRGLTALDDLNLSYNALSSLPAGIFDGLTALDTLCLNNNALSSLRANVFQDLTTLTTLTLQKNSNPEPFAPTAEAGETQRVATGAAVALAGSSSSPWGTNVTYAWRQASGATVTLTGADTARPSFTAPSTAGDLAFTLTVTGRPLERPAPTPSRCRSSPPGPSRR